MHSVRSEILFSLTALIAGANYQFWSYLFPCVDFSVAWTDFFSTEQYKLYVAVFVNDSYKTDLER